MSTVERSAACAKKWESKGGFLVVLVAAKFSLFLDDDDY